MLIGKKRNEDAPSIEMTPIIDMVFLLLIFFLVATTYQQSERELAIALPEAEAAGPISTMLREIIININAQGEIIVGGQAISLEELRSLVADAVQVNPDQKVSVRGDKDLPYGTIARVLDVCKAAGAQQPFLDTVPLG
ncbi:MAG: ExbD/TolR family protein [Phycisphaerales bacterium]|nr:biopolymer transporter ExbD [Phycisphaerales bacterium]